MRIAYLARCDAGSENGVLKKLVAQVERWREAGHEAELFLISRDEEIWEPARKVVGGIVSDANRFTRAGRVAALVRQMEAWAPTVVYTRFDTHSASVAGIMNRVPTILELNTDDITEYRGYLPPYRYWYHRATRGRILKRAAGFVCVTREIADRFARFGRPTTVVANGVDLDAFKSLPPASTGQSRLVFVGSPGATWHGVDKIVALGRRLPTVRIDLIGPPWQPDMPGNVVAHGMLGRKAYETLMAQSDVAIGTLAMHRNGMEEGSTLKVREYLAFGLPCVIGYRDTDFPERVPFILQLPNTPENAVDAAEAIAGFCATWRGRRVARAEIAHLHIAEKESLRLQFLCDVIRDQQAVPA